MKIGWAEEKNVLIASQVDAKRAMHRFSPFDRRMLAVKWMTHLRMVLVCGAVLMSVAFAPIESIAKERIAYLAQKDRFWQVWIASLDGLGGRAVSQSSFDKARVSWYPDGRHLLVNGVGGALVTLDTENGNEEHLPAPINGIFDATISPDGRRIAFSAGTADSRDANDIWVVNENGTGLKRLVSRPYLQHSPTWSRDGRWVYFLSTDGGEKQDIWRVSLDGNTNEQVTVGGLYQFDIATGPGDLIAFSSNRSGNYEIWVQRGAEPPRQITNDPAMDGGPAWNAAGTALVFESTRVGVTNLWYVELDGSQPKTPRQLTHHESGARGAAWWHPPASR